MPTYRLDLAYDGSEFHGFARQPGVRTVQGEVEATLAKLLRVPVEIVGAGRTDAGVHARAQVTSFTLPEPIDVAEVRSTLARVLPEDVAPLRLDQAGETFDARFSARWRAYRYRILPSPVSDPFRRHLVWRVGERLDLEAMSAATEAIPGERDFASFCRAAEGRSTVRRVEEASWRRDEDLVVFAIRASSFCHQMVRSLVGFLVDVGRGRIEPGSTGRVLAARDRAATRSNVAPPHGLVLWDVGYDGEAQGA